jgi:hypothetical protein
MKNRLQHFIAIAFVVAVVAGCASAPSRFYTLNATAKPDGAPAANYAVMVGPVSVPAEVDRPQFTVQVAPNRVAIDEFNRWAAPLNDSIARVVAEDLSMLLGTPRVAAVGHARFDHAFQVMINIQKFESVPDKSVQIEAVWTVRPPAGTNSVGITRASESVTGSSFDALAAAHSRALAKVSSDIAAVIRAGAEANP